MAKYLDLTGLETLVVQIDAKYATKESVEEITSITVDTELNDTSENPVQNKVIYTALENKANTTDLENKVNNTITINGKPLTANITLTATDVNADEAGAANTALTDAKSYTDTKIAELFDTAPETLDTINEIADAIENNQDAITAINNSIANKVDKEEGKGLSTNDFNNTYKTKLDGISEGAEVNQNTFTNITVDDVTITAATKTDTITIVEGNNVTITADDTGKTITINAVDTTYANATTDAAGLMSAEDKTKLDGIELVAITTEEIEAMFNAGV